jgi:hypothetical protein
MGFVIPSCARSWGAAAEASPANQRLPQPHPRTCGLDERAAAADEGTAAINDVGAEQPCAPSQQGGHVLTSSIATGGSAVV